MELDPTKLEAILEMLRDLGVERFESEAFTVTFFAGLNSVATTTTTTVVSDAIPEAKSMFENKALWPGGIVPKFPIKDK